MGSEAITLDINGELSWEQVKEIEKEANAAIDANVPIAINIPEKDVLETMEYRSKKVIDGDVRIVEIPGYDLCACCGTHPFRTGEIRLIKILSVQNYKGGVRISMLAGDRAIEDYGQKHDQVVEISHLLSAKTKFKIAFSSVNSPIIYSLSSSNLISFTSSILTLVRSPPSS